MKIKEGLQGELRKLIHWPLYLLPLLLIGTIIVYAIDFRAGVVLTVMDVVYLLFLAWWMVFWKPRLSRELVNFASDFQGGQSQQIKNLSVPYAVLGEDCSLIWTNQVFDEVIAIGEGETQMIQLLPFLSKNLPQDFEKKTEHVQWKDRAYLAELQMISETEQLYALFLFDETDHLAALQEIEDQKSVIGQIYIDNYEEVMSSAETVRQSLLAALIERKIGKYFGNYDGIVRKTEKDKFIVFLSKKGLVAIQEDRFSVLEDVKTLNIGNSIAVTLSISMGTDGATMEQNDEYCRNAMDLALGRGGDQAIVKTPDNTRYYGGKTQQQQEKNTRVKARVKAQALRELMLTRDQILVMGHKIPDIDSFGSAVGIYRAAMTLGKKAHIIVDEMSSSVRPMAARFQNNSEYPPDMIITSEKALTLLDGNTIVVVVDVNRPSYTECPMLLEKASTIVVLDHHRQGGETIRKATLSYIEPYASSASEMVAEILQYFNDNLKIRPAEAEALYGGIVIDTNNFTNKAGVRTFEAAAFLRRHGADVTRVRKMFRESMTDTKARSATINSMELYEGCFAFGICPAEGIESPTIVGAQAANDMLDIIGVKASFVFTDFNGTIYVSARSIDEVNVQLIMERLGGGGHLSIAGAQLKDMNVFQAKQKVQITIRQMLEEGAI